MNYEHAMDKIYDMLNDFEVSKEIIKTNIDNIEKRLNENKINGFKLDYDKLYKRLEYIKEGYIIKFEQEGL